MRLIELFSGVWSKIRSLSCRRYGLFATYPRSLDPMDCDLRLSIDMNRNVTVAPECLSDWSIVYILKPKVQDSFLAFRQYKITKGPVHQLSFQVPTPDYNALCICSKRHRTMLFFHFFSFGGFLTLDTVNYTNRYESSIYSFLFWWSKPRNKLCWAANFTVIHTYLGQTETELLRV